jgi:Fe-S oxidoreductase
LSQLVAQGKLKPKNRIDAKVAYHDSCYLGRYNEIYEPPRQTLRAIPGLTVLEPTATRDRGMCCGAGGAQMFKEEEHAREGATGERVNEKRTDQLLETNPDMVASSCPFCQRMLIDGLAGRGRESVKELDIAELLWQSVGDPVA